MYDVLKTPTLVPRPFFTHMQMHKNMAATAPIRKTTPKTIPEIAVPLERLTKDKNTSPPFNNQTHKCSVNRIQKMFSLYGSPLLD